MKSLIRHRNFAFFLAFAAAFVIPSAAQTAAPPGAAAQASTPTFSARTELVLVPTVVTHNGQNVTHLTKDDFILQENGVEQKVATFEEIAATATPVYRVSTAGQREFSNLHLTDYAPRRINIIVLDMINTQIFDQLYAKRQLAKYLSSAVTGNELTALLVMTRGGVRMIHDFTGNPEVLVKALNVVKGRTEAMAGENSDALAEATGGGSDQAASEADQMMQLIDDAERMMAQQMQESAIDATLDGFEAIASAFAGVPGRKSLLWISGGFAFRIEQPGDMVSSRFYDRYERFFQQLNSANISIYPIDARGLVVTAPGAADSLRSASGRNMNPVAVQRGRDMQNMATHDTMNSFADMTGGKAFYNTNDLSRAMERAADDSSSYYLLGYYVNATAAKPGWRKISVKVRRPGMQVRARSGYLAERETHLTPAQSFRRDVSEALAAPFNYTAVPFTVKILGIQPVAPAPTNTKQADRKPDNRKNLAFQILLPPNSLLIDSADNNHMNFQVIAVARDATLKGAGDLDQQVDGHLKPETLQAFSRQGANFRNQIAVPPGEYTVKFIVRDNLSGKIGSVTAPVTVE